MIEVANQWKCHVFNADQLSTNNLRKCTISLTSIVEENICSELPQKFSLMMDCCSENQIHYGLVYCL